MNIGSLCHREVVAVCAADELMTAAKLMREKHVGYLAVVEKQAGEGARRLVGVLTDRDIVVSVVALKLDPGRVCVGDIMTRTPTTVSTTDSVDHTVRVMRRIGVRRLPVVNEQGELVGIASLDDVLDFLAGELHNAADAVRRERKIEGRMRP
jgi:CBS domain-containing protein